MNKSKKPKHFEEALIRLEDIVSQMESGEESLENSLNLFEEGTALLTFCKEQLHGAEQKITELSNEVEKSSPEK